MEGLEASIINLSTVAKDNEINRLDASYFLKGDIELLGQLDQRDWQRLGGICDVTDGIHTSIDFDEGSGIKVLSAKHPKDGYFDLGSFEEISAASHAANPRTALRAGDVLLSTVGTIGNAAIVRDEILPANSDRHVGIIRTRGNAVRPIAPEYLTAFLIGKYGRLQSVRETTGNVQPNLFLFKIRQFKVARFSDDLENAVAAIWLRAERIFREARVKQAQAEESLLTDLGLADWTPPEPLTYSARASEALASARIDARFFAPRIQALLDILSRDGHVLRDIAAPRQQRFRPNGCTTFNYIEISDIDGAGTASSTALPCADAPSRATWHVRTDDIITSTVRPIRRLSAQIAPHQDGYVCSSGFVVIRPQSVAPELLLTYLRLPVICELLDLYASASMYPAITDAHIFSLPIPEIDAGVTEQVVRNIREAKAERASASELLLAAKRAVELAIEAGEDTAMDFLGHIEGAH